MKYEDYAKNVLNLVGGKDNVISNVTCMTRLRLRVKDASKIDVDAIRKSEGVLGIVEKDNGIQVVFGPGKVDEVGRAFSNLTGIPLGNVSEDEDDVRELAKENKKEKWFVQA